MRKDEIKKVVEMLKDNPDVVFVAIKKGDMMAIDLLGDHREICWTLHNCILQNKDIYDILNATIKTYDLVEKKMRRPQKHRFEPVESEYIKSILKTD